MEILRYRKANRSGDGYHFENIVCYFMVPMREPPLMKDQMVPSITRDKEREKHHQGLAVVFSGEGLDKGR